MMKQEKPKAWEGLETPWAMQVDRSTGDELHDQIRALQLPDYPQAHIYTDILTAFSTEIRIVVYMDDRPLFTASLAREEVKNMLEESSIVDLLQIRTAYYLKQQQKTLRRAQ